MAHGSCALLVITRSFKEHIEGITFNKDLLTAAQDFQGLSKIFWCSVFKEERRKILRKINNIKSYCYLNVP